MSEMRAKLMLYKVEPYHSLEQSGTALGKVVHETLWFTAMHKSEGYSEDALDENNTYAKYTPTANLCMVISNPRLLGHFHEGDVFYVDFTRIEK